MLANIFFVKMLAGCKSFLKTAELSSLLLLLSAGIDHMP